LVSKLERGSRVIVVVLFNSYVFIFLFAPVTIGVFFVLGRYARYDLAVGWLVAASLFFYGWWNPIYVGLIIISMTFNYFIGRWLGRSYGGEMAARTRLLTLGIVANISLLAYYKYANFFVDNINTALDLGWRLNPIVLPLGISFFTFTQIAYLVDAYRGEAREYNAIHYGLFVTFFPHLIAGPILHHKEMMPQFADRSIYVYDPTKFAAGLSYFAIGLFKKVAMADGVALYASPVFRVAAERGHLSTIDAWSGVLAYTFQIYFDFSGYTDMAIGLALMMGIRMPLNFDSPYKAVNIVDFWRRWHMTLSRFLRDYVYITLGGNRYGTGRRYVNLLATMLLGGLWHGAGWTFIIWGGLHGSYLAINHAWHALRRRLGQDPTRPGTWWGRGLARLLTMLAVIVGWVFFRAADYDASRNMLTVMFSLHDLSLSPAYGEVVRNSLLSNTVALLGFHPAPSTTLGGIFLALFLLVLLAPNSQQIMSQYFAPPGKLPALAPRYSALQWKPSRRSVVILSIASLWALLGLSSVSEFLYFQF
jgi:D-alanyl-lipoteichoic acid acyltransferase DltB (MBOAT superfamily)